MKKAVKIVLLFLVIYIFAAVYSQTRKLPEGLDYSGSAVEIPVEDIKFLYDLTYEDLKGDIVSDQRIWKEVEAMIDGAQEYILIDAFLFNSFSRGEKDAYKDLAGELTAKILDRKDEYPDIKIDIITDPINSVYGGAWAKELEMLKEGGANVIYTDLSRLRDSNTLYSPFWRIFFQWFGNNDGGGFLPHPFSAHSQDVSLRSYLALLNFRANHRKVFMADSEDGMKAIITSANPHDASSAHSNVAIGVSGGIWKEIYKAEAAVALFSGENLSDAPLIDAPESEEKISTSTAEVRILTERKIKESLLDAVSSSAGGDRLYLALFYLSDRDIVNALVAAADRDAEIKIILDPNKDAFGYEKNGIPNRQVAEELTEKTGGRISIRWYDTHGEQFHSKLFMKEGRDESVIIAGSANFTRKNLDNYNLEENMEIRIGSGEKTVQEIKDYFDMIWENKGGIYYTVTYDVYKEDIPLKTFLYRVQELTGACSF